jgi:malate dehydrogenase (oxaloacetate-decarboxylating)
LQEVPPKDRFSVKALAYSKFYGGKVTAAPKVPVRSLRDFSIWYTPGIAAVSRAIEADPELSFEYTGRWNTIAVVTDGSRVLGLGNIGPEGGLPVMEGKALIYNYLGGVNAIPLPVRVSSEEELISLVKALEPSLGGVNLEDIESPKCFEILDTLRSEMKIPVWHDDQQGTAGVVLAALFNSLELTERKLQGTKIVLLGAGAANVAAVRLLIGAGADPRDLIVLDTKGVLHPEREDVDYLSLKNKWKFQIAMETNGDRITGGLREALKGADVLIAASTPGPGRIKKEEIAMMNRRAITFLLANPVPEMFPKVAIAAGAEIVATGRSDYPNQINNVLCFPGLFRGVLDCQAREINDPMLFAAGGLAFERWFTAWKSGRWLKPAYVATLAVTGVALAPFGYFPMLTVNQYIAYSNFFHFGPPRIETHRQGPLPQLYADQFGWKEMAQVVADAYYKLPPDERKSCAIYGQNYGQAGAIDLFGAKMGLPNAISGHQNYFYWGPRGYTGECVIVMEDTQKRLEELQSRIEKSPKTVRWKLRAKIGEKKRWYELPEQDKEIVASQFTTNAGTTNRGPTQ